jgi:hypothetical protein
MSFRFLRFYQDLWSNGALNVRVGCGQLWLFKEDRRKLLVC